MKKDKSESKNYPEYWKKNNPEWSDNECIEAAKKYKKECNYQCIEFYIKRYPNLTIEECENKRKEYIKSIYENKEVKIEYWIKRFPNKDIKELEEMRKEAAKSKNKCNISYWIKKYPDKSIDELNKMRDEYYNNWKSHQKGWGKGENNINSRKKSTKEQRNSRSPYNIEFYERKYPNLTHEEHIKMRNNFFEKNKASIKNAIKTTNLEWYILNENMNTDEAKNALKNRQTTFSLEKCIEKYGEEEGKKRWEIRQEKWIKSLQKNFKQNGDGRSPQSKFAKNIIEECCKFLNIPIPTKEKYIYDKINNKAYAFDFTIKNKIIEFNGTYWHADPNFYDKSFFNKSKNMTAQEIWDYDKEKILCANNHGYDVLTIWEEEYNKDKENIIKKCIDFLTL